MKVCFIYYSVFRHGGVQRVLANQLNYLANFHNIEVIVVEKPDYSQNVYGLDLEKIKVTYIPLNNDERYLYKMKNKILKRIIKFNNTFNSKLINIICEKLYYKKSEKKKFIEVINRESFDLLISCSMQINLLIGIISPLLNCKTIVWEHNSFDNYFENYYKKMEKFCSRILKRFNSVVCLTSEDSKNYKNILGIDTEVISNSISFKMNEKSTLKNKVILSVGRLELAKGTDMLIEIFNIFSKKNREWKLIVLGEGELEEHINKKIKNYNLLGKIEIKPFTKDIQKYYRDASIYACTSRYESFGLAVLEAMESGVPVISFDCIGPAEIIESKKNGILIEKFNIEKFACEMDNLANNSNALEVISREAVKRAEDFSIEKITEKWQILFEKVGSN